MGIREELASEEAGFISIHDVLLTLAQGHSVTYQEAAMWLSRKLRQAGESAPAWHLHTLSGGIQRANQGNKEKGHQILELASGYGNPYSPNNINYAHGWGFDDDLPF